MKLDLSRGLALLGLSVLLNDAELQSVTTGLDINKMREVAAEPILEMKKSYVGNEAQLGCIREYLAENFPEALML